MDNEGGDTFLLDILSKIILEHVQPTKTHIHRDTLAKEILSLLESLCFSASPEAIEKWVTKFRFAYSIFNIFFPRLGSILRHRDVLMVLMHLSQPAWLLDQSSRLLALLSTRTLFCSFYNSANVCSEVHFVDHTLFRAFLNIPNADVIQNAGTEMTRDPLIERLCSHLIETGGSEPEVAV